MSLELAREFADRRRPTEAIAWALIDIAETLTTLVNRPVGVLTDENVPVPSLFSESSPDVL